MRFGLQTVNGTLRLRDLSPALGWGPKKSFKSKNSTSQELSEIRAFYTNEGPLYQELFRQTKTKKGRFRSLFAKKGVFLRIQSLFPGGMRRTHKKRTFANCTDFCEFALFFQGKDSELRKKHAFFANQLRSRPFFGSVGLPERLLIVLVIHVVCFLAVARLRQEQGTYLSHQNDYIHLWGMTSFVRITIAIKL